MMRGLFIFLLLIPLSSFSQYHYKADTSCYSSQHIAFKNDSIHRPFFSTETGMDLFQTVYYLNRKRLLDVSAENDFIASCCVELFTDYKSALIADSTKHVFFDVEMNWDVHIYGFLDLYGSKQWARDAFYENIEYSEPPISDTTYFGFVSIPEIRIEEKTITEDDYRYEIFGETGMKIEQFGFTAFDYSGRPEMFWVNFDLFISALERSDLKTEDLPWYDMLINRKYGGFRYKQTPCDDDTRRN